MDDNVLHTVRRLIHKSVQATDFDPLLPLAGDGLNVCYGEQQKCLESNSS
ncbi:MAG: hypothetical protein ABW087_14605 [Candidatus Thiodiazotropha sp.]